MKIITVLPSRTRSPEGLLSFRIFEQFPPTFPFLIFYKLKNMLLTIIFKKDAVHTFR